ARRARPITAMLDAEFAQSICPLYENSRRSIMRIRASARLPSRRLCRHGLCPGFPRGAGDLVVGRHAPAVPPEAQQVRAAVRDVRPQCLDHVVPPALAVTETQPVRQAVRDAIRLEEAASAQDEPRRRVSWGARGLP